MGVAGLIHKTPDPFRADRPLTSEDMVGDTGLEPVTSCVSSRRSSQSELIAPKADNTRIPDPAELSIPFNVANFTLPTPTKAV